VTGLTPGDVKLFGEGIDLKIVSAEAGAAELTLDVKPSHRNAVGVAHGGAIFTLVDSSMACALIPLLAQGQTCVSIEIKVNNVAPVKEGLLTARSLVAHRGKTIAHVETDVRNSHGRLVAKGLGTFFIRTPATSRE
jgi:acyl-CoA thioesterase